MKLCRLIDYVVDNWGGSSPSTPGRFTTSLLFTASEPLWWGDRGAWIFPINLWKFRFSKELRIVRYWVYCAVLKPSSIIDDVTFSVHYMIQLLCLVLVYIFFALQRIFYFPRNLGFWPFETFGSVKVSNGTRPPFFCTTSFFFCPSGDFRLWRRFHCYIRKIAS